LTVFICIYCRRIYCIGDMHKETLSIRIRKDFKDKISKIKEVDWRRKIELLLKRG